MKSDNFYCDSMVKLRCLLTQENLNSELSTVYT